MRRIPFATGEIYHIYNRGTDKRIVFEDKDDIRRFLQSLIEFNVPEPIGSLYEHSFVKKDSLGSSTSKLGKPDESEKLVNIIAYCLNPNHYHMVLEQVADRGIEKFMQRVGTGYTKYFNNRNERSGVLFQGRFQSVHISSNEQLLHTSVYVNLNFMVHRYSQGEMHRACSSWDEFVGAAPKGQRICATEKILGQFRNISDYKRFSEKTLPEIIERKQRMKDSLLE